MNLTGQCEIDFEKWYINNYDLYIPIVNGMYTDKEKYPNFKFNYPQSMQFGVYVDFFDSVGIRTVIDMDFENEVYDKFVLYIEYKKHCFCNYGMNFKTRPEARAEAIKNAKEIYNLN